jgi:glutamyl-tRNA synthetase
VTGPVFDLKKLEWLNGEWIRRLPLDELVRRVIAHHGTKYAGREDLVRRVMPLVQERMKRLKEWPELTNLFFEGCPPYDAAELLGKKSAAEGAAALDHALRAAGDVEDWRAAALDGPCRAAARESGLKEGDFFMFLRVAVTGKRVSPPLFESMEVLGKEETLARLRAARAKLS